MSAFSDSKELIKIFNELKKLLKTHEGVLKPKIDSSKKYDLWSFKNIEIEGRKRKEVYFAGLSIQSNFVTFHYMPIYVESSLHHVFKENLLKCLKGKSCFHIKKLNDVLEDEIQKALKIGYQLYQKRGWI